MAIFDENKDYYYMDMFNSAPTSQDLVTSKNGLESTIRLYTTEQNQLKRCILVAPYIEPESYSGTNMWTQGGNSLVDIMVETATGLVKSFNDAVKDVLSDTKRIMDSELTPDWAKSMVQSFKKFAGKAFSELPSSDYQVFNLGQFKRNFGGTSVTCPVSSMSTILFSNPNPEDPSNSDYNWFGGELIKNTKQPLRYICSTLLYYLLGRASGMVTADSSDSNNSKKDGALATVQFAPNFINARQTAAGDNIIPRTFAVVVGCGGKADNEINSPSKAVDGKPRIMWNILPTQLTLSPSRLLTPDDDYYYVKIDVAFEMASYLDPSVLAEQWIGQDMDSIATNKNLESSLVLGDGSQ